MTDKDVEVRRYAPRGLVFLLRQGMADDLLPGLAALMKDEDEQVRVSAAETMGETESVEAVAPLLEMLEREGKGREMEVAVLKGLGPHYSRDVMGARAEIDKHMGRVIGALRASRPYRVDFPFTSTPAKI